METTRREYERKMDTQLKQWGDQLSGFRSRIEAAGSDAKSEWRSDLAELQRLERSGKSHLVDLKALAVDSWEKGKDDLMDGWNRVSGSFDAIWARARSTVT